MIKDPERDVTEILPLRSRKFESPPSAHKHSYLNISPNGSSSVKTSTVQLNHLKFSPPTSLHQQPLKHPASVIVSPIIKQTAKTSSPQGATLQSRLPPRMSGLNTAATAATTSTATTAVVSTKCVKVEPTGWVSTTTATPQNVSNKRIQTTVHHSDYKPIAAAVTKATVSKQSSISSSKPLPKPIGSNRPVKTIAPKETTQTTQSTKTGPSVTAHHVSTALVTTTHSLSQHSSVLNSFFSQVATQARSPMIWNDPDMNSETNDVIVTSSLSQTASTATTQCFVSTSIITHTTTPSPSVSPSPSNSAPPSPSCANEERPHLNPIGTERAHKRCSTNTVGNVPRMPAFQPSMYSKRVGHRFIGFSFFVIFSMTYL